jgi:hypothetical protein
MKGGGSAGGGGMVGAAAEAACAAGAIAACCSSAACRRSACVEAPIWWSRGSSWVGLVTVAIYAVIRVSMLQVLGSVSLEADPTKLSGGSGMSGWQLTVSRSEWARAPCDSASSKSSCAVSGCAGLGIPPAGSLSIW